ALNLLVIVLPPRNRVELPSSHQRGTDAETSCLSSLCGRMPRAGREPERRGALEAARNRGPVGTTRATMRTAVLARRRARNAARGSLNPDRRVQRGGNRSGSAKT